MSDSIIDLKNLTEVSRGNPERMLDYLRQFTELVPKRAGQIRQALEASDRVSIRKLIHKMSPQIQFFGINEVIKLKNTLEVEYENISYEDLDLTVSQLLTSLEKAILEVKTLISELEQPETKHAGN